ncbi:TPA: ead/Ea22-like family protein [Klebsiella michiganensis]
MTDITELARRMKAAAVRAKTATEEYASGHMSVSVCYAECEEFNRLTDGPDNIIALVEALEKAQRKANIFDLFPDDYVITNGPMELIEKQAKRIAELEEAEQKLCAANVTLDARAELAERQLAELESCTVTAAAADVLAERQRQVTAEGWTPEHDDEYQHCEMAVAAACYIMADDDPRADVPELWPLPSDWWKPTDVRRDLVKAGALILAEIERLDRAAGIKWEAE